MVKWLGLMRRSLVYNRNIKSFILVVQYWPVPALHSCNFLGLHCFTGPCSGGQSWVADLSRCPVDQGSAVKCTCPITGFYISIWLNHVSFFLNNILNFSIYRKLRSDVFDYPQYDFATVSAICQIPHIWREWDTEKVFAILLVGRWLTQWSMWCWSIQVIVLVSTACSTRGSR
jgi:hypothetical protein